MQNEGFGGVVVVAALLSKDSVAPPSPSNGSKSPRTRSASPPRGREDRLPITLGNQSVLVGRFPERS